MTIEERAIAYRDDVRNGKHGTNNTITDAYYVGATEQKQIDIEKACEWLTKHITSEDDPQQAMWIAFIKEFKKAMEE